MRIKGAEFIYRIKNCEGEITWPDMDELFELSKYNEVFIKDPVTKELIQVLDLTVERISKWKHTTP